MASSSSWKNINGKWITKDGSSVITKASSSPLDDVINNYGSLDRRLLKKQKQSASSNVLRIGQKFSTLKSMDISSSVSNISQSPVMKRWQSVASKVYPEQRSLTKTQKSNSTVIKIKSSVSNLNTMQNKIEPRTHIRLKPSSQTDENNNEKMDTHNRNQNIEQISVKNFEDGSNDVQQSLEENMNDDIPYKSANMLKKTFNIPDTKTPSFTKSTENVPELLNKDTRAISCSNDDKTVDQCSQVYTESSDLSPHDIRETGDSPEGNVDICDISVNLDTAGNSFDTTITSINSDLSASKSNCLNTDLETKTTISDSHETKLDISPTKLDVNPTKTDSSTTKCDFTVTKLESIEIKDNSTTTCPTTSTYSSPRSDSSTTGFDCITTTSSPLLNHSDSTVEKSISLTKTTKNIKTVSVSSPTLSVHETSGCPQNNSLCKDDISNDRNGTIKMNSIKKDVFPFIRSPLGFSSLQEGVFKYDTLQNNSQDVTNSCSEKENPSAKLNSSLSSKNDDSCKRLEQVKEKLQNDIKSLIKTNGINKHLTNQISQNSHLTNQINQNNHKLHSQNIELLSLRKLDNLQTDVQNVHQKHINNKKVPPKVKRKPLKRTSKFDSDKTDSNLDNTLEEAPERKESISPIIVKDISLDSEIFKITDSENVRKDNIFVMETVQSFPLKNNIALSNAPFKDSSVDQDFAKVHSNNNSSNGIDVAKHSPKNSIDFKENNNEILIYKELKSTDEGFQKLDKTKRKGSNNIIERPSSAPPCTSRYDRNLTQSPKLGRFRDSTLRRDSKRRSVSSEGSNDISSALQHLICDIEEDKICDATVRPYDEESNSDDINFNEINTISDTLEQLNRDLSQLEMTINYELSQQHGLRRCDFDPHKNEAALRQLRDQRLRRKLSKSVGLNPLTRKSSVIWAIVKKIEVALVLDTDIELKSDNELKIESFEVRRVNNYEDVEELSVDTFVKHLKLLDKQMLDLSKDDIEFVQMGAHKVIIGDKKFDISTVQIDDGFLRCHLCIQGRKSWSLASLAYDTLISKDHLEKYCCLILSQQFVVFFGPSGNSKSYLASKMADFISYRANAGEIAPHIYRNITTKSWQKLLSDVTKLIDEKKSLVIFIDGFSHEFIESGIDISELVNQLEDVNPPIYVICTLSQNPNRTVPMEWQIKFKWIWLPHHQEPVEGLLQRFLRRKFIQYGNPHLQKEFFRIVDWLNSVWKNINRIIEKFYSIEATLGPTLLFSCPTDILGAEEWFIDTWNYSMAPYFIQAIRQGIESRGHIPEWEDPLEIVLQSYPWVGEKAKKKMKLREIRLEDIGFRESCICNFDSLTEQKRLMSFLKQLETLILDGGLGEIPSFKRLEYLESSL